MRTNTGRSRDTQIRVAIIGAAEGLRLLEIVFAAYRSAELHAPVQVEYTVLTRETKDQGRKTKDE
jgi:hypothetical protein